MTDTTKCPFCGATRAKNGVLECETFERGIDCYENQIAQQQDRIAELEGSNMSKMTAALKVRRETYHVIPWPEKCCYTCEHCFPDWHGNYCDLKMSVGGRVPDSWLVSTMGVCQKWAPQKTVSPLDVAAQARGKKGKCHEQAG